MSTPTIQITYEGKYEVGTGSPFWLRSFENGVVRGEVRFLANRLMFASQITTRPLKASEIWWTPVPGTGTVEASEWRNSLNPNALVPTN